MKIEGSAPLRIDRTQQRKKASGAGGVFSVAQSSTAAAAERTAPSDSLVFLDPIVGREEIDPDDQRKQFARRGQQLLQSLDHLYAATLTGLIDADTLIAMQTQIQQQREQREEDDATKQHAGNKELATAVLEIETRLQVELAKRSIE